MQVDDKDEGCQRDMVTVGGQICNAIQVTMGNQKLLNNSYMLPGQGPALSS